jgi:hypothetical protein
MADGMVWYGMVPLLPRGPQSLRPGGGSWIRIGRRLSTLRLRPFRPRCSEMGFVLQFDKLYCADLSMHRRLAPAQDSGPGAAHMCSAQRASILREWMRARRRADVLLVRKAAF